MENKDIKFNILEFHSPIKKMEFFRLGIWGPRKFKKNKNVVDGIGTDNLFGHPTLYPFCIDNKGKFGN